MKILYVITKSNWGGAQKHVFELAKAMKDRGHEVTVALGGDGLLRKALESEGIYTHSIAPLSRDVSLSNDFRAFKEIFSIIKYRRPDVLHLHSPKAAGLGSLAGRLLRVKKIIQTIHGWTFNEDRPWFQRLFIMAFSYLTMALCHTTILLSNKEFQQGLQFPGMENKLLLIPPGIVPPVLMSIEGAKLTLSKLVGVDISKRTTMVTLAELHPNKGLSYLIESMSAVSAAHPESLLIMIGDGEEKESLKQKIKSAGLNENILLTGYLENAHEYLKAFSFMILPSVKEGLPYAILEAGSASLPVVATTVGGIPEVVEDMKSGILVQARNSRELSHAISFIIEHPSERKKYGIALRAKILEDYSLSNMVKKTEDLYLKPSPIQGQ